LDKDLIEDAEAKIKKNSSVLLDQEKAGKFSIFSDHLLIHTESISVKPFISWTFRQFNRNGSEMKE